MSIFIKGMKMPQLEKNETMQMTLWNDNGIMRVGIQTGGYWCSQEWAHYPVMEISTPHGRLIDADDVKSKMIPLSSFSVQDWISEVELSNCRTVIEAEGETE